ncbi:MAG TPA: adenylate/guanylate cyclase domain-containing protein [Allosphingosinicella sp.]|jgi:adenylate cyclase
MAEGAPRRPTTERLRRALKQIGLARLALSFLFLLGALWLARASWELPLAGDAERALYDLRVFRTAGIAEEQDPRIVLITYDDDTLRQLRKRSPLDRAMLARALRAIDAMGPRGIGIDILLDQPQDEDEELLQTLRGMRAPVFLGFASAQANAAQIGYEQEQFLREFIGRAGGGRARPASIRMETDQNDNVVRRWPAQRAGLPPYLANALSSVHPEFATYTRSIDFRLPRNPDDAVFVNLPIHVVAEFPDAVRESIAGRYVLIGGNIFDDDDFETPMTRFTGRWTKGVEVHAHMLAQQLDGRMPAPVPHWALWAAAILAVAAGAFSSLLELRGWKLALILAAQIAAIAALPFWLQSAGIDTLDLPAFGWGAGWLLAFVGVGIAARAVGSEQRRFAQSALGKYLPRDIASEILRQPELLALRGEKREIYALFTDLEGFTKLSHAITAEQLSTLLNRYLDLMSEIVLRHGGTIDKFVGDAVVAFWGAPIARPDDAERAAKAAVAMFEAGEAFRRDSGQGIPPIGCTRVGLHRGEAVVGNFGGEGRIQYTALGDGMNTAARLESANKLLKTTILVSAEAMAETGLDWFRPMGRVVLSGRATAVELWEPVPHLAAELRASLADLWRRFEAGEAQALAALEAVAAAHKEDEALQLFVYRLREVGPGGSFVLASK